MNSGLDQMIGLKDCKLETCSIEVQDGKAYNLLKLCYIGPLQDKCVSCGSKMYRHGARKIRLVDTPMGGRPTVIDLSFPRLRCCKCGEMTTPSVEGFDDKRRCTNRALIDITDRSLRNTFEDVCNDYLITGVTAKNIFEDFIDENKEILRFRTPEFLGIDEIKIRKLGEITVITDLEHHTLYDILPKRNTKMLSEYFRCMPEKEKVKWVCSDMYRPFEHAIGEVLPNAEWAIDHFHLVAYANLAVDDVRKQIQNKLSPKERIKTKKGLAYTLKTRARDLTTEETEKIRILRTNPKLAPMAVAFDLKEAFFDIYDDNLSSIDNAKKAFEVWENSIPADAIYEKFRALANTVHNFYEQIFNFWRCPIAISNGFTECTNRMIRENNCRGRGYSFKILRGRTLYRKTNLASALAGGQLNVGPGIPEYEPVFHFNSTKEDASDDFDDFVWENGECVNAETGEVLPAIPKKPQSEEM